MTYVVHDGWLCTFTRQHQLEIPLVRNWAAPVRATGMVWKRHSARPVHHVQNHICRVTLLQPARRAPVQGQPSSLRPRWQRLCQIYYWRLYHCTGISIGLLCSQSTKIMFRQGIRYSHPAEKGLGPPTQWLASRVSRLNLVVLASLHYHHFIKKNFLLLPHTVLTSPEPEFVNV